MAKHKYIETPDKLWELFTQYRQWVEENPVFKEDYVGKDAIRVDRKLNRPLSFTGFECYLFENEIISDLKDYEWNKDNRYADYAPIISRIKKYIETDQFDGATAGVYNPNIIARKLGLADNVNSNVTGLPKWFTNDTPNPDE